MSIRLFAFALLLSACGTSGPETVCVDGLDDDGDGLIDCDDADCFGPACAEYCFDAMDNDGDGVADCLDNDCDGQCPENCFDNRDNDGDGDIDGADSDCFSVLRNPENCTDTIDNDGDGKIDCADPDCYTSGCPEICGDNIDNDGDGVADCYDTDCDGGCDEQCSDGRDNDGDGDADCDDSDCSDFCINREICDDNEDNDGDILVDCEDNDCFGPNCDEICGDGADNDGDGTIDCNDPDCDGGCDEDCDDGRDNDGDGNIDCDDSDCEEICGTFEDCFDLVDNDRDLRIDCDDPDCWNPSSGCPEICDDSLDNDGDGDVDCADSACLDEDHCEGSCTDGVDGNDNGLIDCDDPQCRGASPCSVPEICDDGQDNDLNGLVDCEDAACQDSPVCSEAVHCDDGEDNDDDGLVDCDDDDCWGLSCHPDGVTSWVTAGAMARGAHTLDFQVNTEVYGACFWEPGQIELSAHSTEYRAFFLADIEGQVRVNVGTESGGTTSRTCDWSMDFAMIHVSRVEAGDTYLDNEDFGPGDVIDRRGLAVQSTENGGGCLLAGSDWLPQRLTRINRPFPSPRPYGQYFPGLEFRVDSDDNAARYLSLVNRLEQRLLFIDRHTWETSFVSGGLQQNYCAVEYRSSEQKTGRQYEVFIDPDTDVSPPEWTAGGTSE